MNLVNSRPDWSSSEFQDSNCYIVRACLISDDDGDNDNDGGGTNLMVFQYLGLRSRQIRKYFTCPRPFQPQPFLRSAWDGRGQGQAPV